jgi:NitT/TauT family transport system ATP-binding protein
MTAPQGSASAFIPSYRDQTPEVAARFARIKQRPVILEVRGLEKHFTAPGRPSIRALEGVSFQVHRRELMCVIGPSGCGKSTLARLVAGLEDPTGGEMLLDGKPIHGPGADRGMVFQSYTLFPWLTVLKNVMFGLEMTGKQRAPAGVEPEQEARTWLELVGLTKFASAYPHQLSGGMKQRVAIARALANRPRILLMDEPFGALDAQTRCQMQSYLLQIWRQVDITILFITHDLDEAVYLADRILILDAHPGRLRELMEVPVARPRDPDQFLTPTFIAARHHLEELIHPRAAQVADKLPAFHMTNAGDDVE